MRYLKHKTYDLIYDHDYEKSALELFGGHPNEFEALVSWVSKIASVRGYKLRISFSRGLNRVTISKVPEGSYSCAMNAERVLTEKDQELIHDLLNR